MPRRHCGIRIKTKCEPPIKWVEEDLKDAAQVAMTVNIRLDPSSSLR